MFLGRPGGEEKSGMVFDNTLIFHITMNSFFIRSCVSVYADEGGEEAFSIPEFSLTAKNQR